MRNFAENLFRTVLCVGVLMFGFVQVSSVTFEPIAALKKQDGKLNAYIDALAKQIDPRVSQAIGGVQGAARQLLALRGYLRSANSLKTKWSWTNQEIAQYKQSSEYAAALAEVKKVAAKFEELNPGYSIYVNTNVRSLDAQIKSFNETKSVTVAADDLLKVIQQEISKPAYKDNPDEQSLAKFRQFLENQKLSTTPTVASPGLSQHGQLKAFDFQIKKGNQIVAGTDSTQIASVWDAQGWTQKLNTAIASASQKFSGPLDSPREPWHYTYNP